MTIAVSINNQNIRIVAAERSKVTRWETVELLPDMVKDGQILRPEETAKILDHLFENHAFQRSEINVSISGMSFIYRVLVLPRLKGPDLKEAILRATQKEINLAVDEMYIDWQIVNESNDRLEIFVLCAPRSSVDMLVRTFKLANLKLNSLDINALALTRLVDQPRALIAEFEKDRFDIVIVSEGVPVTLHSVAPKGNNREFEDNLSQMEEEIRRTVDFFNLTHKDNALKPEQPVYWSGERLNHQEDILLLKQAIPTAINIPAGQLIFPDSFQPSEYAVALGLILKSQAAATGIKKGKNIYRDVNLNLIAARSRALAKPVEFKSFIMPALIVIGIIILTPLLLMHNGVKAENSSLNSQFDRVNHLLALRRLTLVQNEITSNQITQYLIKAQAIRNERKQISGRGELSDMIESISTGFSQQFKYSGIETNLNQIIVDGWAEDRQSVLDYTAILDKQNRFSEVRIGSIEDQKTAANLPDGVIYKIIIQR
jgi:Tfp pilus assembly PilM family ATPase